MNKKALDAIVKKFHEPRPQFNGQSFEERRKNKFGNRVQNVVHLYSKHHLPNLSMQEAEDLYVGVRTGSERGRTRLLWRFKKNSINSIRKSIEYLLYGNDPLHKRFTEVADHNGKYKLSGAAQGFVSTLLHSFNPKEYAVWNESAKNGLRVLGLYAEVKNEETIGKEYQKLNELLKSIAQEYQFEDLSIVDELLHRLDKGEIIDTDIQNELDSDVAAAKPSTRRKKSPPAKKTPTKTRITESKTFVRNPKVVEEVKEAESWTCQVCGTSIDLLDGGRYCQVHHIRPLSEKGDDSSDNALCLCPNHHVEMEKGLFYIESIDRTIVHVDETNPLHGHVLLQNQNPESEVFHELDYSYLKYHRDKRCPWADR